MKLIYIVERFSKMMELLLIVFILTSLMLKSGGMYLIKGIGRIYLR